MWKESEILDVKDDTVRGDMLRQFNDGTRLNKEYVLRTFPIYHDGLFHGNTNIHMSSAWALAEASRLRNDTEGMQLVGKQFRWIFGANPFGQSLMYGVGYDFAPQFAYCLKDVVGSLPVGMDCMSGDMPHWAATNTATSKEIWVEPVNRFLGAISVYNDDNQNRKSESQLKKNITLNTETVQSENGVITVTLIVTGTGKHIIGIKEFNAETSTSGKEINLPEGGSEKIRFELKVSDRRSPFVAVISVDNDPDLRKEIFGSYIKPSF
ncbi:MAG: hypothetical protein IPN67_00130 [Bacteroidales bacterium]|nr:hypothetical protein [Bacteroidales bacterium]